MKIALHSDMRRARQSLAVMAATLPPLLAEAIKSKEIEHHLQGQEWGEKHYL